MSFKPQTDDVRESPALEILPGLISEGAVIRAYDPVAVANARENLAEWQSKITFVEDNYEALEDADALILLTEWALFRRPDFARIKEALKQPVIFDGRNQYNPQHLKAMGFDYYCVGR